MFSKLVAERMETIEKLHNSVYFNNLKCPCKGPTANVNFDGFIDAATLYDVIKSKRINQLRRKKSNEISVKIK